MPGIKQYIVNPNVLSDTCFRCPDGEECYSTNKGTNLFTKTFGKAFFGNEVPGTSMSTG
jgi:hypothetical protein